MSYFSYNWTVVAVFIVINSAPVDNLIGKPFYKWVKKKIFSTNLRTFSWPRISWTEEIEVYLEEVTPLTHSLPPLFSLFTLLPSVFRRFTRGSPGDGE